MAKVKPISGLDCAAPADKMVRLVLRAQLKAMCDMRDRALDWDDPKGVHDMRVFSRRLRSAISDFKPYLDKSELPRLKLRDIARSLGTVRDEDVALSALADLSAVASEQTKEGLELFAKEHRDKRDRTRTSLKKVISRPAIKDFRKEFQQKLRAVTLTTRLSQEGQTLSFKQLGCHVVRVRLREIHAAGQSIYFPFEVQEIHNLRILGKRLRYALELFAPCFGSESENIAQEISLIQDSLGGLHDCDVWIEKLGRLMQSEKADVSNIEQQTLRACAVWLLDHFSRTRAAHYQDSLARWHRWEIEGFLENLELTINSQN